MFNRKKEKRFLPDNGLLEETPSPKSLPFTLDRAAEQRVRRALEQAAPCWRHRVYKRQQATKGFDLTLANHHARSIRDLYAVLGNKLLFQHRIVKRKESPLGRLINRMTAEHNDVIEVLGRELQIIMQTIGYASDAQIEPSRPYLLDYRAACEFHEALGKSLDTFQDTNSA